MTKITAAAFSFAAAFAAAAGFSPASAQTAQAAEPSPVVSAATGSEARIAPVAGSPDADVGIAGFSAGSCDSVYSAEASQVGPVFGDPEKDTVARTVVGTDCR